MVAGSPTRHAPALFCDDERAGARPNAAATVESQPSLRALFEQHYGSVSRLLRRLGVPQPQLDDAAQEVFWVAARRLLDILPGKETTFLYGVALRVALNEARHKRSAPSLLDIDELSNLADQAPTPEEQLDQRQSRDLLDAVLERLPMELRTVFVLAELEGLTVPQIAELEAIAVGTASSRLRRARQEFKCAVKRLHAALTHRERL
jgi:RNA polymerase sigma-70 factor (ECF subfamily)